MVKLLNAVSSVVVYYHYVLGVGVFFLRLARLISSPSFKFIMWIEYNCKHYGPGYEPSGVAECVSLVGHRVSDWQLP